MATRETDPGEASSRIATVLNTQISRRGLFGVAAAGAAAAFLAACGSNTTPTTSPAAGTPAASAAGPSADASAAASSAATAGPSGTGILRIVGDQVLTNLDPRTSLGPDGVTIRRNVFHTLLQLDASNGAVTPLLASEMPTQESDTSWLVKIRSGLKWHDGSDVTANDVKYTVDWMLNKDNNSLFGGVVLDGVDSIAVVDDTSVRFKLKRPIGSFLERLGTIAPVPQKAAEALGKDKFKIAPVGLGPFKFTEFVADDHETIERWDGYTMGPKPSIARAELRRVNEGTARTTALQAGQAEVDLNADPELFGIMGGSGLVTKVTDNDAGYNALIINNGKPPFNDKRVRQALSWALDRDEIVKAVWNGNAVPMYGPLPPWHYVADPNIPKLGHDPDKAKALLKDAGLGGGVEIELMQGIYSTGLTMAAVLQKQLEAVGFKVRIKTGDAEGLYSFVFDKSWTAFSMRGNTSIVSLYPDVMTRWTLQSVFNNVSDAELGPLNKALADADAIPASQLDARKAAYAKLQATIADEQRIVFICNRKGLAAWAKNVSGISMAPDGVPDQLTAVSMS